MLHEGKPIHHAYEEIEGSEETGFHLRLHGPSAGAYQGQYDPRVLWGWERDFGVGTRQKKEIFCHFDHDEVDYAFQDALRLQRMIREG
jgi:uncharacterized protein YecE (DUF72 family)